MSYNMYTTCWPHVLYMVLQGRTHSSQHGLCRQVYKVDSFVKNFLLSSLVLSNIRLPYNPTLSYNIRTQFLFQDYLTLALLYLFLLLLFILNQGVIPPPSPEEIARPQTQRADQSGRGSQTICLYQSLLVHFRCNTLYRHILYIFFYQPCVTDSLVVCLHKRTTVCS